MAMSKFVPNRTVRQVLIDSMVETLDNRFMYGDKEPRSENEWNSYIERFCKNHEYKSEMWAYYLNLSDRGYRSLVKAVIKRLDDLKEARKTLPSTAQVTPVRVGSPIGEPTAAAPQYKPVRSKPLEDEPNERRTPNIRQRTIARLASEMWCEYRVSCRPDWTWINATFNQMGGDYWQYYLACGAAEMLEVIVAAETIAATLQEVL